VGRGENWGGKERGGGGGGLSWACGAAVGDYVEKNFLLMELGHNRGIGTEEGKRFEYHGGQKREGWKRERVTKVGNSLVSLWADLKEKRILVTFKFGVTGTGRIGSGEVEKRTTRDHRL